MVKQAPSRLRRFWGIKLILAIGSTLFALYLCEFLLSAWKYDSNRKAARAAGVEFDARSVREVVQALRRDGEPAAPAMFPAVFLRESPLGLPFDQERILPLGGLPEIQTVYCNESGEYAIYMSDEHGFRNPKNLYHSGQIEILLVGDSFAHGACVATGQDLAGHLRTLGFRTLNLGMSDNGPLLELASLREYGTHIRPRHVFWFYYEGNDLGDLRRELGSDFLQKYLAPEFSQDLPEKQSQVESALWKFLAAQESVAQKKSDMISTFDLPSWVRLPTLRSHLGLLSLSKRTEEAPLEELRTILAIARDQAASWGGTLHFVYLPEWTRFGAAFPPTRHRAEVLRIVEEVGLPFFDVQELFSAAEDPLHYFPFRRPNHYNRQGYQHIAIALSETIQTP